MILQARKAQQVVSGQERRRAVEKQLNANDLQGTVGVYPRVFPHRAAMAGQARWELLASVPKRRWIDDWLQAGCKTVPLAAQWSRGMGPSHPIFFTGPSGSTRLSYKSYANLTCKPATDGVLQWPRYARGSPLESSQENHHDKLSAPKCHWQPIVHFGVS